MFIIVSDRNRITRNAAQDMNAFVAKSGEGCVHVSIDDYADAVRIFTLQTAKPISMSELRKLLNQKPWPQRVYEWWHSRKAVNA